jgi:hypothetical protein
VTVINKLDIPSDKPEETEGAVTPVPKYDRRIGDKVR